MTEEEINLFEEQPYEGSPLQIIDNLKSQLTEKDTEIAKLKEQLSIRFEFEDSWKREKEEKDTEIERLQFRCENIKDTDTMQMVELQKQLEENNKQIEELEKRCNELFFQVNEQIAQIEKMKCGQNCKHSYLYQEDRKCEFTYCDCINCKDKWELKE